MPLLASALFITAFIQPTPKPSVQEMIVHLTNLERRKEGMVPLKMAEGLMKGAQSHAEDMAAKGYFSHTGQDGSRFDLRCERAGYRGSPRCENIAMGASDPAELVGLWMDSPGHKANILNPGVTEIGIGFASPGAYSVMCLGVTSTSIPVVLDNEAPIISSNKALAYLGGRGWATKMRFSTDGKTFGEWQPHASFARVDLPAARGVQTLTVEFEGPRGARRIGADSAFVTLEEAPRQPPASTEAPAAPAMKMNDKGIPVADIVFPVLGKVTWSDTFGDPRDGGARQHQGQDLPAPKMRPLLAAFDGVWQGMTLISDAGLIASYIHLNNDTPGTDDGQGGEEYRLAPGIWDGVRVVAGQFIAYCGDSGNAEEAGPHLHFELAHPNFGTFNAAPSLLSSKVLSVPAYVPEHPELQPQEGQVRWDAEVRALDEEREVLVIDVAAIVQPDGRAAGVKSFTRRYVKRGVAEFLLKPGDYIAVIGPPPASGEGMKASGIKVLRSRP